MNPILPRNHFVPDAEAHVMPDGRLYLYGSYDISGNESFCSDKYHVFSTDDPKLINWVDHGISFENTDNNPGVPWVRGCALYAPDAICKNDKYYLFSCSLFDAEGVSVSDSPAGPFSTAVPLEGANGNGIDPAVFVDDDGQAYFLWGQFSLKGGKLTDDMTELIPDSIVCGILTEHEHGFHEGASIRKRNGKYYIVYTDVARGRATCLSYAIADNPLGPYSKGGVIIDNIYCDPSTWNNHGSIEEFCGKWYVFYHRSSQNSETSRRVCAEPITFNDDGTINEVIMTSQGADDPIPAASIIDASIACRMKGNLYIAPDANSNESFSNELLTNCGGGNYLHDWAEYRYIDFADGVSSCKITASGKGRIYIKVNDINGEICSFNIDSEPGIFTEYKTDVIPTVRGIVAMWIFFDGSEMSLDTISFE